MLSHGNTDIKKISVLSEKAIFQKFRRYFTEILNHGHCLDCGAAAWLAPRSDELHWLGGLG